jgi:hypothetical protein
LIPQVYELKEAVDLHTKRFRRFVPDEHMIVFRDKILPDDQLVVDIEGITKQTYVITVPKVGMNDSGIVSELCCLPESPGITSPFTTALTFLSEQARLCKLFPEYTPPPPPAWKTDIRALYGPPKYLRPHPADAAITSTSATLSTGTPPFATESIAMEAASSALVVSAPPSEQTHVMVSAETQSAMPNNSNVPQESISDTEFSKGLSELVENYSIPRDTVLQH